jgi:hypothetical protein
MQLGYVCVCVGGGKGGLGRVGMGREGSPIFFRGSLTFPPSPLALKNTKPADKWTDLQLR